MKKNISRKTQVGFALIEVVVAICVAVLIGIVAISLLRVRAVSVDDNIMVSEAVARADEGLSALTTAGRELALGGSFSVASDNSINANSCSAQTCDYVLLPDQPESARSSPAKGIPYGSTIPEGASIQYLRRWRVEELNATLQLRKITIAVLRNEKSTQPVVLLETGIGLGP